MAPLRTDDGCIICSLGLPGLMAREAKNPAGAGLLFDWGIVSSIFHALVMMVQTFMMWEHEMPHLWADIPLLFAIAFVLWWYHPKRVSAE